MGVVGLARRAAAAAADERDDEDARRANADAAAVAALGFAVAAVNGYGPGLVEIRCDIAERGSRGMRRGRDPNSRIVKDRDQDIK